ncbi:MAG: transcription-repair coupling factor, partial [Photobacterium halotolerans]
MTTHTLFSLPLPNKAGDKRFVGNVSGAALAVAIAELAKSHTGPVLAVVPDTQTALRLQPEISQFSQAEVNIFPDWETLPYDSFSPHQDIISDRLARLYQLPTQQDGVLLVPVSTLLQRLTPRRFIHQHALLVSKGDRLSLEKLR